MKDQIKLGAKVRDTITGFAGVATSRTEYLNDGPSIGITGSTLHDGKPVGTEWIPEWRVEPNES